MDESGAEQVVGAPLVGALKQGRHEACPYGTDPVATPRIVRDRKSKAKGNASMAKRRTPKSPVIPAVEDAVIRSGSPEKPSVDQGPTEDQSS